MMSLVWPKLPFTKEEEILIQWQEQNISFLVDAGVTERCQLGKDKRGNVHTDSSYIFGSLMILVLWNQQEFLSGGGATIRHSNYIKVQLIGLLLPEELVIIKIKVHTKKQIQQAKGNALADYNAKWPAWRYI